MGDRGRSSESRDDGKFGGSRAMSTEEDDSSSNDDTAHSRGGMSSSSNAPYMSTMTATNGSAVAAAAAASSSSQQQYSSFAQKMMSKMGHVTGKGLGKTGQGEEICKFGCLFDGMTKVLIMLWLSGAW